MSDLETVRTIATIAAPLSSAIVDTWIKPKLNSLSKYFRTERTLLEKSLSERFEEYLSRAYERHSFVNVIVFQNQQKKLKEIYIPLTVRQTRVNKQIKLDSYREEFVPAFRKTLIRDTAGMGKSTVLRWLFLSCVERNAGIPIFVELRKLRSEESILDFLYNELNPIDDSFDIDLILNLIKHGDFVFFLDGYDEIPLSQRDEVTRRLQEFLSKAGNNLFIMTSRPEASLASFPDFQEFTIDPLKLNEAFDLLRKYDRSGELSAEIISRIQEGTLENIKEFLKNPMLTSLLYKSYEYKHTIPFKKHIFYRQVYDALFESHDLTKGGFFLREKRSGLDIEDFHRVLRALGFMTVKLGQIEFDKDTCLSLIGKSKKQCYGLEFKESDFLTDLLTTVPLFNRDGYYFKWAHKSIQEYFAAQFIWLDAKDRQIDLLHHMVRSDNADKYTNVLDLYYDMDYKTLRHTIVYEFLRDFLTYYNLAYSSIDKDLISELDIHDRKLLAFGKKFVFVKPSLVAEESFAFDSATISRFPLLSEKLEGYRFLTDDEVVVTFSDHNAVVNQLLATKPDDIFVDETVWKVSAEYDTDELSDVTPGSWEEESAEERALIEEICRLRQSDVVVVDEMESVTNSPKFFSRIHRLLYGASLVSERFPDPKKCEVLKTAIEHEKLADAADDFLFSEV